VKGAGNVQGADVAWALIDAVKNDLSGLERNYVFVTLGAGDIFAAIHQLLKLIATKKIALQPHLVMLCRTWLGPYAAHEEYDYLLGLIEGFLMPNTIRASAVIRCLPSTPKPPPLLTVTGRRPMRKVSC
jgi:hypothetical protein